MFGRHFEKFFWTMWIISAFLALAGMGVGVWAVIKLVNHFAG